VKWRRNGEDCMGKHYSVIVVGAGLAGLSVARGLHGVDRVLLVDRSPVGSLPIPPHETLAPYVEQLGCSEAIVQRFTTMDIHTPLGVYTLKLFHPHCTLNYKKLCELILSKGTAEFRLGNVEPVDPRRLKVNGEVLEADFIVDASGWRAVIASSLSKNNFGPISMTYAMGTVVKFRSNGFIDSPTYFFDHRVISQGGGFVIPFGDQALVGVGSYVGRKDIGPNLHKLLKIAGLEPGVISRRFIPNHGLRPFVVNDVFVVGDAAGQTKPVRGKGILRGTLYGLKCGELLRQVLDGRETIEDAKRDYYDYVGEEKPIYLMLDQIQQFLSSVPGPMQSLGAAAMANDNVALVWDKMY
jgi:menaquinone-9 beta-reductase